MERSPIGLKEIAIQIKRRRQTRFNLEAEHTGLGGGLDLQRYDKSKMMCDLISYLFSAPTPPFHTLLCGTWAGNVHTTFLLCQLVLDGQSIRLGRKKDVIPSCLLPLALFVFSTMSPQQGFSTLQQHGLSLVAAEYSWQFFQLHHGSTPPLPPLGSCISSNVQFHLHMDPLPGF